MFDPTDRLYPDFDQRQNQRMLEIGVGGAILGAFIGGSYALPAAAKFLSRPGTASNIGRGLRSGARAAGRAASAVWRSPLAGRMADSAVRVGARAAVLPFAVGLGLAATAGRVGMAAAYAGYKGAEIGGKILGGGRSPVQWEHGELLGMRYGVPSFTPIAAANVAGLGMAGAAAVGSYQGWKNSQWSVNRAIATGTHEIERPDFLGATGSLTLASRRRSSASQPTTNQTESYLRGVPHTIAHSADDALRMLLT